MDYSKNQVVITHSESLIEAGSDDESGTLRIKSDSVALYNLDIRNDYSESGKIAQAIAVSAYGSQFGAYACRFFSYQVSSPSSLTRVARNECYSSGHTSSPIWSPGLSEVIH